MSIREVDFGTKIAGKADAAFTAITAWAPIYENYDDPTMSAAYRAARFPLVLLVARWDGTFGFVGGFVEEGLTLEEQARKESLEEAGLAPDDRLAPLIAHETDNVVAHLFVYDLSLRLSGIPAMVAVRTVVGCAASAEHSVAEGNVFWAHLADYGRKRGWRRLRDSNNLADGVGEELDAVRAWMHAHAPEGAYLLHGGAAQ